MQGRVKMWNDQAGWGFIVPDPGQGEDRDAFVHHSKVVMRGRVSLVPGQRVEFEPVEGPKGLQACRVEVLR